MLTLLVPGVGMGASDVPVVVGDSVTGGRYGVRRPVTMYCLIPALLVALELLRGR